MDPAVAAVVGGVLAVASGVSIAVASKSAYSHLDRIHQRRRENRRLLSLQSNEPLNPHHHTLYVTPDVFSQSRNIKIVSETHGTIYTVEKKMGFRYIHSAQTDEMRGLVHTGRLGSNWFAIKKHHEDKQYYMEIMTKTVHKKLGVFSPRDTFQEFSVFSGPRLQELRYRWNKKARCLELMKVINGVETPVKIADVVMGTNEFKDVELKYDPTAIEREVLVFAVLTALFSLWKGETSKIFSHRKYIGNQGVRFKPINRGIVPPATSNMARQWPELAKYRNWISRTVFPVWNEKMKQKRHLRITRAFKHQQKSKGWKRAKLNPWKSPENSETQRIADTELSIAENYHPQVPIIA